MTSIAPSIRWSSILLTSVCVWVFGVVWIAAIIFAYAFSLGFAARGAPDPEAIRQFANAVGPIWGPRLSIVFTGVAAIWLGRQVTARPVLHGLLIGLVAGGTGGWLGRHIKGSTSTPEPTRHAV